MCNSCLENVHYTKSVSENNNEVDVVGGNGVEGERVEWAEQLDHETRFSFIAGIQHLLSEIFIRE